MRHGVPWGHDDHAWMWLTRLPEVVPHLKEGAHEPPSLCSRRVPVYLGAGHARAGPRVPTPSTQKLIVGVKEAPPFAIKQADNTWSGLSIELWQAIATDLQLSYAWRELDLPGLLQGVADGSLDVVVAALTITPERERLFDFTQPFYITQVAP